MCNLALVALLGVALRYNQVYYLPFVDQRNLLHAHSHLAFSGWISFLLQVLVLDRFLNELDDNHRHWRSYLLVNCVLNYVLVISFAIAGYTVVSIAFSTLSLLLSYYFSWKVWRALRNVPEKGIETAFLKAGLLFLALSSLGPYYLAYLKATHNTQAFLQHNALYWFLHFQYNGFFSCTVFALLIQSLRSFHIQRRYLPLFYYALVGFCIPAYFLVFIHIGQSLVLTMVGYVAAAGMLITATALGGFLWTNRAAIKAVFRGISLHLLRVALAACLLKMILQVLSVLPRISQLVFGYRAIVIGYLHLVLLVFISMCLIAFLLKDHVVRATTGMQKACVYTLLATVLINEVLLACQGMAAIINFPISSLYPLLLYNAAILFMAATGVAFYSFQRNHYLYYNKQTLCKYRKPEKLN